jgi:protease-4
MPWIAALMLTVGGASIASANPVIISDAPPAAGLPDYWGESRFLIDVPGVTSSLAAGFFNPAAWPARPSGGFFLAYTDPATPEGADDVEDEGEWLGVLSMRGLAFGMRRGPLDESLRRGDHWSEYTLGIGGGDRAGGFGVSYSWSRDGEGESIRHDRVAVGMIHRWRPVSYGVTSLWDLDRNDYLVQADVGIRPIGPRVTLFAEAVYQKDLDFDQIRTGYGLEVLPRRGLSIGAKALNTGEYGVSLRLGLFEGLHPDARVQFDNDGEHVATTYAVETELPTPSLGLGSRGKRYPEMELRGPIAYERYRFFDKRRTLLGLLRQLDACATDPKVGGVVLNLSGVQASPEMLWELREQLAGLRAHGKKVIVYFDRLSMAGYGLASVADQIWMDPLGDLEIPGLALGRTYLRGALDKLGLGIDELRFFTYKSAFEGYSRTSMSDADREQLGAMVDDFYETMALTVTTSRGIGREAWDRLVDQKGGLLPREALEAGLVDSLGTFEQAKNAARKAAVRATGDPAAASLGGLMGDPVWSPMEWGRPDRIALLYAIGPCEMDSGIRGRLLSKKIKAAADDRGVKAIVLRADSPGGDPLPSDLVAREMKAAAKKKPVIVSQGQVAGSGGYWISMYGDSILASPLTVTGSIGVISGWVWDNGLGEKLGITYDKVQRGAHADLGNGMRLPLVNEVVPDRPFTTEERSRAEGLIRTLYGDFVKMVAEGRGMTETQVDAVGQGRIWSGTRGKEKGLVDEIGGLWRSLEIAKTSAGIPIGQTITLTEGPGLGAFNFPMPSLRLFGLRSGGEPRMPDAERRDSGPRLAAVAMLEAVAGTPLVLTDYQRVYLDFLLRARGAPLLLMEPFSSTEGLEP